MSLRAGTAFVDLAPRLAKGFEKAASDEVEGPISRIAHNAGKILAGALAGLGTAAVAFGIKSAKAFKDVGSEVNKLIRYTGGSAESMSKLRFAAKQSGIETDALAKGLGILSKHLAANDKAAKAMGVAYRDANGHIKPLDTVLAGLADRFAKMPNGPEKSALAMQLFGKAGTDLIPFLNKGSAGLAELSKKAEEFGLVLTQNNLDAIKKNVVAQRDWSAALEGLQVQVGAYVLPILTAFVTFITRALMPVIKLVADLAREYLAPAFEWAFGILEKVMGAAIDFATGTLLPGFKTVFSGLVDFLTPIFEFIAGLVMDYVVPAFRRGWSIVTGIIAVVVEWVRGRLWPAFKEAIGLILGVLNPFYRRAVEIFDGVKERVGQTADKAEGPLLRALKKVGDYVNDNLAPILAVGISGAGLAVIANQALNAAAAFGGLVSAVAVLPAMAGWIALVVIAVAALVAGVIYAYTHFEGFRNVVDAVGRAIRDGFGKALEWLSGLVAATAAYFQRIWPQIQEAVTHVINVIAGVIRTFVDVVMAIWRAWGDDILRIAKQVWDFVKASIENALQIIRGIIQLVLAIINGDWGKAWDAIKQIVTGVLKQIWDYIETVFNIIRSLFGGFVSTLQEVWSGLWNTLKDVFMTIIRTIVDTFLGFVGQFLHGAASMFSWVPGIGGKLKEAARAFDEFRDDVNRSLGGIKDKTIRVDVEQNYRAAGDNGHAVNLRAAGGPFRGPTIVGEEGIELLDGAGHVTSNSDLAAMLASAMSDIAGPIGVGATGGGPAVHIEHATFQDEVDLDILFDKAEFAANSGAF